MGVDTHIHVITCISLYITQSFWDSSDKSLAKAGYTIIHFAYGFGSLNPLEVAFRVLLLEKDQRGVFKVHTSGYRTCTNLCCLDRAWRCHYIIWES